MKAHSYRSWALAPLFLAPLIPVHGADNDSITRLAGEEPKERLVNRFGVSYNAAWNINARFYGLGSRNAPGPGPGPATGGNVDRNYDDGYNRVKAGGNSGGFTWNYGYKNASQYDPEANTGSGTLTMHSTSMRPGKTGDVDGDPQHGFQMTYSRELCHSENDRWAWGFEVGFGWNDIQIDHSGPVRAGTRTITDVYDLGGVDPRGEPTSEEYPQHAGDPFGPGPLIPDSPQRTVTDSAKGGRVTGYHHFDADMYVFRVGPYLEFPIVEKLHGVVSGGLAVGVIAGSFAFSETETVLATGRTTAARGEGDNADAIVGGYGSVNLLYPLNDRWSVFTGGQVQAMTGYSVTAAGRKMKLDLGAVPSVNAGIAYSF